MAATLSLGAGEVHSTNPEGQKIAETNSLELHISDLASSLDDGNDSGQPPSKANDMLEPTAITPSIVPSEAAPEPASSLPSTHPSKSACVQPVSSPAPRRPKPPIKGILKPPPLPPKPTLTNRLREIASVVGGGARTLFEPVDSTTDSSYSTSTPGAGPSTAPITSATTVGGAIGAISGRLGLGLSRLVGGSPTGSPAQRTVSLPPENHAAPMTGGVGVASVNGTPGSERASVGTRADSRKRSLKRATFVLPSLSITYPISSQGEPWSQKVLDDRQKIESTHRDHLVTTTGAEYWTSQRLVALYENACRIREEKPRVGIIRALEVIPQPPKTRHIHLLLRPPDFFSDSPSNTLDTPLGRHSAESLADVLSAEWSLSDLRLEGGILDSEDALKPILHGLLVSGTLPSLSLAGNKNIRAGGWRLVAVFLKRARSLKFIDLSDTLWDKRSIDYLVLALNSVQLRNVTQGLSGTNGNGLDHKDISKLPEDEKSDESIEAKSSAYGSFIPPAPLLREDDEVSRAAAVQTLRMDGCGLRATVLETLAQGVRSSDVRNISLRRNKIGPLGAVALALMMRDYPDSVITLSSLSPGLSSSTSSNSLHIPVPPPETRSSASQPSSAHASYASRSRRPASTSTEIDPALPPIPSITTSTTGGITTRTMPDGYKPPIPPKHHLTPGPDGPSSPASSVNNTNAEGRLSMGELGGASMALQRSVRALDGVERIGRLLTLDLKGNEIKNGVGYIAQVLKRNRTLKVLNLSDNRIEPAGLAAIAEALKYNSSLETLDMSLNPCCGPSIEGVSALRNAFTLNTSLKRLFLSDTSLTTDGAISLAEFLPECKSILHLDMTSNPQIEIAGILALSVGLRSNTLLRCLDISIPTHSPDIADLSQNILQLCIRNTELAASAPGSKGKTEAIWAPIKKSELVKCVKEADEARASKERLDVATSPEGQAREFVYTLSENKLLPIIEATIRDLNRWFAAGTYAASNGFHAWQPGQLPKDDYGVLYGRVSALRERLVDTIQSCTEDGTLEKLLVLNDELGVITEKGKSFSPPPRLLLPSQIVPTSKSTSPHLATPHRDATRPLHARRHIRIPSAEISSPNFSIGDSDNDSDAEELDVQTLPNRSSLEMDNDVTVGSAPGLGVGLDSTNGREVFSPVERVSRAWVEEEGEIFRKGTKLGVADEEEVEEHGDVSGEQLRQEILDTPVARSPTRRVIVVEGEEGEGSNTRENDNDTE